MGVGVEQNANRDFDLLLNAANKGETGVLVFLGHLHLDGRGVEWD